MFENQFDKLGDTLIPSDLHREDERFQALRQELSEIRTALEAQQQLSQELMKLLRFNTDRQYYFHAFCNPELSKLKKHENGDILLIGNYGDPNLGDEWMLQTLLQYLPSVRKFSMPHITLMLSPNRVFDTSLYLRDNVSCIHYPQTIYDYDFLADHFDAVIFGGGAIIEDEPYWNAYDYGVHICRTLVDLPARCFQKRKQVYCLGLSTARSLSNEEYLKKLQDLMDQADRFTLRDENSLKTLEAAGLDCSRVRVVPDLIYAHPALMAYSPQADCPQPSAPPKIGLSFILNADTREHLRLLLKAIKKSFHNPEVTFLPFYDCWNNDSREIEPFLKEFPFLKAAPFHMDLEDTMEAYEKQDLIISMRYHGSLLAFTMDKPVIPIYYDSHVHYANKMDYLLRQFGFSLSDALKESEIRETVNLKALILKPADDSSAKALMEAGSREMRSVCTQLKTLPVFWRLTEPD